jgi:hypothetical protein
MGPEVMMQYLNPQEFLKRLAAASGIDYLELVKTEEQLGQEQQQAQQQQMMGTLASQAGQLAKSPLAEQLINGQQQQQPAAPEPGTQPSPEA